MPLMVRDLKITRFQSTVVGPDGMPSMAILPPMIMRSTIWSKAMGAPDISRPISKPSLMRSLCMTSPRSSRETLTVTASVTWLQSSRR